MQDFYDAALFILKILRDPIWGGISSICSLIGIPLAIILARRPHARLPQPSEHTLEKCQLERSITLIRSGGSLLSVDGYHRLFPLLSKKKISTL